jgi:hypothetical protein
MGDRGVLIELRLSYTPAADLRPPLATSWRPTVGISAPDRDQAPGPLTPLRLPVAATATALAPRSAPVT